MRKKEKTNFFTRAFFGLLWKLKLWNAFYSLFWKAQSVKENSKIIYEARVTDLGKFTTDELFSPVAQHSYLYQNNKWSDQSEFLSLLKSSVSIEPSKGLILYNNNTIVEESRINNYVFPEFSKNPQKNKTVTQVDRAYYFDGHVGESYYHFFSEVLSAYFIFIKHSPEKKLPIIIHKNIYALKWFQFLLATTDLSFFHFIILDDTHIVIKNLYFAKGAFSKVYWQSFREWIKPSLVVNEKSRRVFLDREIGVGRNLKNKKEILEILNRFNFEIIDTENFSMEEQIELMGETKFLVAIHGAGLTNLIFSDPQKISVLEINPIFRGEDKLRPHYYWLAKCLNINYQCIEGGKINIDNEFILNPDLFETYLEKQIKLHCEKAR
jgi:hypothetical protein